MSVQADDPGAARRSIRRLWLWWGIPGAMITAVVGAWWYVSASAQSRFDETLASLRAQGFALRLQDLAPPPVPDEENAAPIYLQAVALFGDPTSPTESEVQRVTARGFDESSESQRRALKVILDDNARVLSLLREARGLPKCRFRRDYSRGIGVEVPEQEHLDTLASLLRLRIAVEVGEGRVSEALESARDAFALAECYRDEPIQACQSRRAARTDGILTTLEREISHASSQQELESWLGVLPRVGHYDRMMAGAFHGEVAMVVQLLQDTPMDFLGSAAQRPPMAFVRKPAILRDGSLTLEAMARQAGLMTQPWWQVRREEWKDGFEAGFEQRPSDRPVAAIVFPDAAGIYVCQVGMQAHLTVLRAGLAWEIARARDGKYPGAIPELDPFAGKPLLYDAAKGVIYSVGRDGKDDHGVPEHYDKARREEWGDIIYKLRHHP